MKEHKLLDGKAFASELRAQLKGEVEELRKGGTRAPGLAVVLVGDDPASASYVRGKERACEEVGISSFHHGLDAAVSEEELIQLIDTLNADPLVDGILVQLPLPAHINEKRVTERIDPAKDADGLHPVSVGHLSLEEEAFIACTPHGIIKLLEHENIKTEGAHVVIVGRSNIVGKPLASLFLRKHPMGNATVTVCHSRTPDLASFTRSADILVAAIGRPAFITGDMVKRGAVVVDVGINRVEDAGRKRGYRLVGDVDFEGVLPVCSRITPVPGGVGPLTIAMLLFNTLAAARMHLSGGTS